VLVVVSERLTAPRRPAFYKVDLSTGSFQRLFDLDVNGRLRTGVGGVSPDGKVLYLGVRADGDAPVTGIVAVDLATGDERQVMTFNSADRSSDFGIAVSPDGSTLAVTVWTKAYASGRLFTVGTDGSGYRELVGTFATGWLADKVRWTPDGRSIVFTTFDTRKNWRIMRVAADGGPLAFDGLDYDVLSGLLPTMRMWKGNFNNIDLSPDGSRIVVSALTSATFEIWTLDGLMNALDRH
jgi:Tol biopolymer transport system component